YECREAVVFPSVTIDGSSTPLIAAHSVSPQTNQFYDRLSQRHNWFYAALHYYIYTVLQLRDWLPESFVTREYLPVGNPDTTFIYGYVEAQCSLQIQIPSAVLENYDLYLTRYRRSSLPLFFTKMEQESITVPAFAGKGYYLIRIRPRVVQPTDLDLDCIEIRQVHDSTLVTME
ncbi:MAG: DUF6208 family protein, partial [Thermosynechococcaceae cyanobacterium]